jgi:hypothetical protein
VAVLQDLSEEEARDGLKREIEPGLERLKAFLLNSKQTESNLKVLRKVVTKT